MSDKSLVIRESLYYARLLEDNLGEPDFIGVGCATPRQVALSRSVPREQFFNLPIYQFINLLINLPVRLALASFSKHFFTSFNYFFNSTFKVESSFWEVVEFTIENHIKTFDSIFDIYVSPW